MFVYILRTLFLLGGRLTEHKIGFVAQVTKGNKITIPHEIRKLLGIKTGDLMNISEIHKVEPREAI